MRDQLAAPALTEVEAIVEPAHALPQAVSAEIWIAYFPGVGTDERWLCQIDADGRAAMAGVWGTTARQAVERAVHEVGDQVTCRVHPACRAGAEWYWRDAWFLASLLLAGSGAGVDLADVLGATRRSSTPAVFMDRHQVGWAVSRLIASKLVAENGLRFAPSVGAGRLWRAATGDRPPRSGRGLTRRLFQEMPSWEPGPRGDLSSWTVSEPDYLAAIRNCVARPLAG
jgi:hypothetical protein